MLIFITMLISLCAADQEKISNRPEIIQMHFLGTKKRTKNKRKPLALDEECCIMAQEWANYMAKTGKFHHGKKDQIISRGYQSTDHAFRSWMNSSGHRYWLLSKQSTKCGWGCQQSKGGTWYWVGVFR
jgi:uncharacterized protein YkwD